MYTERKYKSDVKGLKVRYYEDNMWFTQKLGGAPGWPPDDEATGVRGWDISISRGWEMYEKAKNPALGFLVLGDTAIRANEDLLFNFGLNSAHGVQNSSEQDKAAKNSIDEQMNKRRDLDKRGTFQRLFGMKRTQAATEILGPGSILSDKYWSPLLNDSFILGGINKRFEFHLAFATAPVKHDEPGVLGSYTARDPKEKWKAYLIDNPDVYWNGNPRVFARETLGLMFFGYRPVFTDIELVFGCRDSSAADGATLQQYIDKLHELNFHRKDQQAKIMGAISAFLFGEEGILTGNSPVATKLSKPR